MFFDNRVCGFLDALVPLANTLEKMFFGASSSKVNDGLEDRVTMARFETHAKSLSSKDGDQPITSVSTHDSAC